MSDAALPVLMYHGLHVDAQSHGRYEPVYSVRPTEFAAHLDWLVEHGYRSVRLRDLTVATTNEKNVVISFDDGDVSNAQVALPLLRERGMVAEFFVTSDFVGQTGMLTAADVRTLVEAGMSVQSHGRSHRFLEDLNPTELDTELRDSKRLLEAATGVSVDALALPGGRGGERERIAALDAGYRYLLNSEPGPNRSRAPGRYLQRLSVQRGMQLDDFATLVTWRGLRPRIARLRYHALALPKVLLGNRRYEQLRARVLGQ
jgi:peptidoglycan/xylan/chitin deacetylase (PgdA/CDA1 family)